MSTPRNEPGKSGRSEAAQAALKLVSSKTITFGLAMIAVIACMMMPLPWSLAGLGFGVVAYVVGARTIKAVRKAPPEASGVQMLVMLGMGLTTLSMLALLGQAIFYPAYSRYQTCQAEALTDQAAAACDAQFAGSLNSLVPGIGRFIQTP